MTHLSRALALLSAFMAPLVSAAATTPTTLAGLIKDTALPLINGAIAVLFAIAVAVFFVGLVRYIASAGGAKEKVEGKNLIFWGIVALFVTASIYGILALLRVTFFGGGGNSNLLL